MHTMMTMMSMFSKYSVHCFSSLLPTQSIADGSVIRITSLFQILGPLQTVLKLVLFNFHFLPNDQSFVSSSVSVKAMKDWNEVTVELVDSLIHYTGILEVIIFWKP